MSRETMTREQVKKEAQRRQKHASSCQQDPTKCPQCQENIRWFQELPPDVLAIVLSD